MTAPNAEFIALDGLWCLVGSAEHVAPGKVVTVRRKGKLVRRRCGAVVARWGDTTVCAVVSGYWEMGSGVREHV